MAVQTSNVLDLAQRHVAERLAFAVGARGVMLEVNVLRLDD
jgi:hypothetical protein